jgi:hypothetical protein
MQPLLFLERFNLTRKPARVENGDLFIYSTEEGIVHITFTASTQDIALCV